MNRLAMALIGVGFAAAALLCRADSACRTAVMPSIKVGPGELTLADLLEPKACPQLHQLAAQVNLGAAPRAGSERVFEGREIGRLIDGLAKGVQPEANQLKANQSKDTYEKDDDSRIPRRIVVRRQGATKSCAEIAEVVALTLAPGAGSGALDCAAAHGIPQASSLEVLRTDWNVRLRRWEYRLRCVRAEDCVPFLVWSGDGRSGDGKTSTTVAGLAPPTLQAGGSIAARLVKRGQTATLTWDQGGIRIVLPVTCLDEGGLGQFVRVQLPNAGRTLRAEVVGEATLRAQL
jgi:hypothetical protein